MSDGDPDTVRPRLAAAGAALLAAGLLAGCATQADDPTEPRVARGHAMSPYVVHEQCLRAAVGERIDYYFTSTLPVHFNIHYHDGGAVAMPIAREQTRADSGVFLVPIAQDYCLTWEAGPGGATLDYRYRLRPRVTDQ